MDFMITATSIFWVSGGVILLIAGLLIMSFEMLVAGLVAVLVSLVMGLGLIPELSHQLYFFGATTIALMVLFKAKYEQLLFNALGDQSASDPQHDTSTHFASGAKAEVVRTFDAAGFGRVSINGVEWVAKSESRPPIGSLVSVIRHDGIVVTVSELESLTKHAKV